VKRKKLFQSRLRLPSEKTYNCPYCDNPFPFPGWVWVHLERKNHFFPVVKSKGFKVELEGLTLYYCPLCTSFYGTGGDLKLHMERKHWLNL